MTTATPRWATAEETLNHPSYPSTIWALEPEQRGLFPAAKTRGGPVNINWEIHGSGPTKLVLIMGLAGMMTGWQRQTLYFGHERSDQYSVLILDNRGIGGSDKPLSRYTSSEMALDVIELLEHLEWTSQPRQIHLAGISLGGMIAQEIAFRIPDKLSSLNLFCTTALFQNTDTFSDWIRERLFFVIPQSESNNILGTAKKCFPIEWLTQPDQGPVPAGSPDDDDAAAAAIHKVGPAAGTNDGRYPLFETNYQRFLAQELSKRRAPGCWSRQGFLCQLTAAGYHTKSDEQLRKIAEEVGRDRILVIHGTADKMIQVSNGQHLIDVIQPGTAIIVEGMGHAPIMERAAWLNAELEKMIKACAEI